MKRFLRVPVLLAVFALLVVWGVTLASAQFLINSFDTSAKDSMWNDNRNPGATKAYIRHSDDAAVKQEGAASLKSVWQVHTTESWGGNWNVAHTRPRAKDSSYFARTYRAFYKDSTYFDWSTGTHLSIWYNNQQKSSAAKGGVQMRFHIYEAGPGSKFWSDNTNYEDWYYQTSAVYDTTPGWRELVIPLKDNGAGAPNDQGFTLPGWSGAANNEKLDFDKIIGYCLEFTAGVLTPDTAFGVMNYDNLRLMGIGKKTAPFYAFNNFKTDTANFAAGWGNNANSKITFWEEKVDTLIAPSALGVQYAINVAQDWGGGVNREYVMPAGTFMPDLSAKQELVMYMKVVEPLKSSTGAIANKITVRFILKDYGTPGTSENWYTVADVRLDSIGQKMGWQTISMPLDGKVGGWGDLKSGYFTTPQGAQDGVMQLNKIGNMIVEFSASRDAGEPYAADLMYTGKILIGPVVPSGVRETDKVPPAAVTGLGVTKGSFTNLITWTDVPGEPDAKYNVFASEKPFTKVTDAGVEDVPFYNLPLATQLQTDLLRSPITDQDVTRYYGVTATDKAGNQNLPTVFGPVVNKAKGVPTISKTAPPSFVADGDLKEWAGITPVILSVEGASPTAFIAPNTKIDGNADLFVKAYLASDANNLYVAFDVDDDVVDTTQGSANNWLWDSPDLFIGLYDWRGPKHGSYMRGATPDYHLRFHPNRILIDNPGKDPFISTGANYSWTPKLLTSGYIVEARIPFAQFAAVVNDSVFHPVEGMRIPIDFAVNDRDGTGDRQGIMCYSPKNEDHSYENMWRWVYTWIGAKSSTLGVEDEATVANAYGLMQNYPNPFNPSTLIKYSLAKAGMVTVKVYDVLGREVATLVNDVQAAGTHQAVFNSANLRGGVSSGVYFYKIESGSFRDIKKMMLVK